MRILVHIALAKDSYRYGRNTLHWFWKSVTSREIKKNHFSIISTSSKVVLIFKIGKVSDFQRSVWSVLSISVAVLGLAEWVSNKPELN